MTLAPPQNPHLPNQVLTVLIPPTFVELEGVDLTDRSADKSYPITKPINTDHKLIKHLIGDISESENENEKENELPTMNSNSELITYERNRGLGANSNSEMEINQ